MAKKLYTIVPEAWGAVEDLFREIFSMIDDSNVRAGAGIKGSKLAAGTVTATELADGAVTRLKFGEYALLTAELPGAAFVGETQAGMLLPSGMDFLDLRVYSQQAPTGAGLIVTPKLNGVAIVTPANRPTVAAGANASNVVTTFSTSGGVAGDRLTFDVDQVGFTVAGGSDLLIAMTCKERGS